MKTLVIGDIHFPFHNARALAIVYKAIRRERPDVIVQVGDLLDQYVFSRYPRNLSYITPADEVTRGLKEARRFWKKVRQLAPRARLYQLIGNHDVRLAKRIGEKLPELKSVINPLAMYQFPGVMTMQDDRAELRINGMVFHHGYLSRLGDHAKQFGRPTIVGHSHRGGIVWHGPGLWELNAGFLADESLLPLNYGAKTTSNWTLGYGLIDELGPRFIPIGKKEAA